MADKDGWTQSFCRCCRAYRSLSPMNLFLSEKKNTGSFFVDHVLRRCRCVCSVADNAPDRELSGTQLYQPNRTNGATTFWMFFALLPHYFTTEGAKRTVAGHSPDESELSLIEESFQTGAVGLARPPLELTPIPILWSASKVGSCVRQDRCAFSTGGRRRGLQI